MISVVIPLFNKAHTIIGTLTSVLAQTYTDFEVVIINDGSTDNGVEIINKFTSDSRVCIINQVNQGVSIARNRGVVHAKYEYIAFLDGDDEWLPGYLSKMKEAIDLFPDAGMYCSAGTVRNADGTQNYRIAERYKGQILEINFFDNPHVYVHTSATVVSKAVFNRTIGFPPRMSHNQDFSLFFSVALISKVVYSGYMLSIYVGGVEGQTTSILYKPDGKLNQDSVPRHNLVYQNWIESGKKNTSYLIFMKYELRHTLKIYLMNKEFFLVDHFFNNLNPEILDHFSSFEKYLYRKERLRKLAINFIILTKLRWRIRGYPRVDVKSSKI